MCSFFFSKPKKQTQREITKDTKYMELATKNDRPIIAIDSSQILHEIVVDWPIISIIPRNAGTYSLLVLE